LPRCSCLRESLSRICSIRLLQIVESGYR